MRTGCVALMTIAFATSAAAQNAESPELERIRHATAMDIQDSAAAPRPSVAQDIDYIVLVARPTGILLHALQVYTEDRSDKQIGAGSSASGTTTLVSKGAVPKVLGLAVENGAVTQTQDGTTVTFRTNVGGAARALAGKGFFQLAQSDDPSQALLGRLSASASFDTSRGEGNSTLTADQQQLSQWTARIQLLDQRDPRGATALSKWRQQLFPLQTHISRAAVDLSVAIERDAALQSWLIAAADAVSAAKSGSAGKTPDDRIAAIEAALESAEAQFPGSLQAGTIDALTEFERSSSAFVMERDTVLKGLASGALASLEYTNDRPLKAPHTSNIRLIGEVGGTVDLAGNLSLTFFDQNPVGVTSSVRDLQFSGQMDIKMGSADTVGAFIFSAAGKFVRQFENGFSDDGIMIPNTKGTIVVGQFKLTVPVKGAGVKVPLSVTFANRTDLIKESVVRANVGLTYDLDTVFARFRP
jgi:hypothetical protein